MITHDICGAAHWANLLINDNPDGLSIEELAQANAWRKRHNVINVLSCGDEFFTWAYRVHVPESQASGGNVIEYVCEIRTP